MRQYVLVSYDVCDAKRLRQIYKLMRGYGEHIQYSVFLCQLTDNDMVVLKEKISDVTNQNEDQVMLIRLGNVDAVNQVGYPENWQVIGRKIHLRDTKVMVF